MVLEDPIDELHQRFSSESEILLSRSFFLKHRPSRIKKLKDIKFNQSLCEICENFNLTCKSLANLGLHSIFRLHKNAVVSHFLCDKGDSLYHKMACLDRSCRACGSPDVASLLNGLPGQSVSHSQWVYRDTERGVKRKMLVVSEIPLSQCLKHFVEQMGTMPSHLFHAQWQYQAFISDQKSVGLGELVTVMDFAENYRCMMQDEVQAAYWNYQQATVHPMVNYYRCPSCTFMKSHTIVAISNDVQHGHHAVEAFWAKNLALIREEIPITTVGQWSDGCGVQYKSRAPFANVQMGMAKYGVAIERNFFGSRHGKNPSDGVSANVKNKATRAVRCRRAIIQNAKDLFDFLQANMSLAPNDCDATHNIRSFIYVDRADICRQPVNAIPLKGTRALHVVKSAGDSVLYRNLSCLCISCKEDGDGTCLNRHYVEDWKRHCMLSPQHMQDQEDLSLSLSTSTLDYLQAATAEISFPTPVPECTPILPATSTPRKSDNNDRVIQAVTTNTPSNVPQAATTTLVPESDNNEMVNKTARDTLNCTPGTYVEATIHGVGGIKKDYYGIIQKSLDCEYEIKFMERCGNFYVWPWKDDVALVPVYDITRIIKAPQMAGRGRYEFNQ